MDRAHVRVLCMSVMLLLACAVTTSARDSSPSGGEWTVHEVTYEMDPDYENGPSMDWKKRRVVTFKERTSKIWIPADMQEGETIRGVMTRIGGFREFAHRNRIALYDGGAQGPYGCINKTFLKAAAEVTKRPELEHAGAILQGLSNVGRFEAHAAHFWPEKVIAVILDHSWCGGPCLKAGGYSYGQLPVAEGIPFFFNSSQKDKYQGFDRRALHFNWCRSAFTGKAKQPCTSVISYEDVGHNNCGDRSLQITWLEEVLALRVPVFIDPNGAPYKLKPVDVNKVGGHVKATLGAFDGRSIHTDVAVGPVGFAGNKATWWIPGPRSAAEMLEWVRKNDGKVALDGSSHIKTPYLFESSDKKLASICKSLTDSKFGMAYKSIDKMLEKSSGENAEDKSRAAELRVYKKFVDDQVSGQLESLDALRSKGDLYHLKEMLASTKKRLAGVTAYDEASKTLGVMLRSSESMANLREGRRFYYIIEKLQKSRRESYVRDLKKFADKCPEGIYGKMAARISEDLAKGLNATVDLDRYRSPSP